MTELRSWVVWVLAAVTVAIALGAGVQIARADAETASVVVSPLPLSSQTAAPAPASIAPPATTTSAASTTKPVQTTTKAPRKSPAVDTSKCTNRLDYSDDPRDNATINSIGADTGTCPAPMTVYQEGDDRTLVEDQSKIRDVNGETYAEACRRMGYEPGPKCPAS